MIYRETAFISFDDNRSVRCIAVKNIHHLLSNMKRFKFFERKYNIYSSVARFDFSQMNRDFGFPPFSFQLDQRAKDRQQFNQICSDYVLSYDFVLDFDDNGNFNATYKDVSVVKNQFDVLKIPYVLKFTGSGFHIIVPGKYLPPEWKDKPNMCRLLAEKMSALYDLSTLDMKIYDLRRISKISYSIDVKTGLVCYPLTDDEFDNFSKAIVSPQNVIKQNIFVRNSLLRDGYKTSFQKYARGVLNELS